MLDRQPHGSRERARKGFRVARRAEKSRSERGNLFNPFDDLKWHPYRRVQLAPTQDASDTGRLEARRYYWTAQCVGGGRPENLTLDAPTSADRLVSE